MAAELRPELAGLKAYEPEPMQGDAALDANESPFAPPGGFMQAARARLAATLLNRYPDPQAAELRRRLAALHGLPPASLLFGNGSDELIGLLLTAFGGVGSLCAVASPSFSMYALCAKAQGWDVLDLPLDGDFQLDGAFVAAVKEKRPKLVFLASPNNPTGNALYAERIDALRNLPGTTLVLDEAYADFGGRSLLQAAPGEAGLIVLRTFSKAWGLAALRLGWLCAEPALVAELEKVRLPYNVNTLTQALACEALERSEQFLERVPRLLELRGRLEAALKQVPGAVVHPSDANFVLMKHPKAEALHASLLAQGLRVRRFSMGRLAGCLRINAGDEAQTLRLEKALQAFTQEGKTA